MKTFLKINLALFFVLTVFSASLYGETYKWVDEKGVIHFQDYKPAHVAPKKVEILTEEELKFNNYVDSRKESDVKSGGSVYEPKKTDGEEKKKVRYSKKQNVELYVTSWCGWCKKAKSFFKDRGISFIEYDVEKDEKAARRHKELNRRGGVPVAVINGKKVLGFSAAAYENALKKR